MNRNFSILLCLLITGVTSPAFAEGGLKIAYVDIQKALEQTDKGKDVQETFKKEVEAEQKDIDKKKVRFEKLKNSIERQKDSLSDEALREKQEALRNSEKELKRAFQDSQEKLRRKNASLVGGLIKKMRDLVARVAREEGYDLVLEKKSQGLLFINDSLDMTGQVVKKFNEEN